MSGESSGFHLHVHEGASPEAVRAAVEAYYASGAGAVGEPRSTGGDDVVQLARRAYDESEGSMQPLLEFLADNAERLVSYREASRALEFPTPRSMPGLLGAFGRRANHRYHGVWPFDRGIWANGDSNMRMSEDVAAAIRHARDARETDEAPRR